MTALFKLLHLPVLFFVLALSALGAETLPVSFSLLGEEDGSCRIKANVKAGAYLYAGFTVNGIIPSLPEPVKNAEGEDVYKKSLEFTVATGTPLSISSWKDW